MERLCQLVILGYDKTRIFVCSGVKKWIETVLAPAAAKLEANNVAYLTALGLRSRLQLVNKFYVDFLQRDSDTADAMLNIYLQRVPAVKSEGCGAHRFAVVVNGGEYAALGAGQTKYGRVDFDGHFTGQVSAKDCSRKHFAVMVDERGGRCTINVLGSSPTFVYNDAGTKVATLMKGDDPRVLARGQYVRICSPLVGADLEYRFTDMYDLRATMARCDVRVRRPTASKRPPATIEAQASKRPRASVGAQQQGNRPHHAARQVPVAPAMARTPVATDSQSEPMSQEF